MARARKAGFDERRESIVAAAALQFARDGYDGASINDLSATCNIAKSVIYHYFPSKEDLLFAVMWGHASSLVQLSKTLASRDLLADDGVRWMARVLLEAYLHEPCRHKVLMREINHLGPEKRAVIVQAQRDVMEVADNYVARLSPALRDAPKQRLPYVMMFFGMLNWTHTWFNASGPVSAKKVADIAAAMFLRGLP